MKLNKIIPENIQTQILHSTDVCENEYFVYRVSKTGEIEESTFDSTYEEILKRIIPPSDCSQIGTYSTSTYSNKKHCEKFLKFQKKKYSPPACLIQGFTKYGLTQKSEDPKNSHINWWIYEGCKTKIIEDTVFNLCDK